MIFEIIYSCLSIVLLFFSIFLFKQINIVDKGEGIQKSKMLKGIPLAGGVFFIFIIFIYSSIYKYFDVNVLLVFFLIFLTGVISDIEVINKPSAKIYIQIFIILALLITNQEFIIIKTSIPFIDNFLTLPFFSELFTIFCILICINGSNFIDGTNGNVVLNSIKINFMFYYLITTSPNKIVDSNFFLLFVIALLIFLFFNFKQKVFLGDSGSYLLGFFNALNVILITQYYDLSPMFAVGTLFYICFENLFSFIRKISTNKSPLFPDQFHLHMLLKANLKYYYNQKTKLALFDKELYSNNFTSIIIGIFNLPFIYLVFNFRNSGYIIFYIVTIQLLFYSLFYILLRKIDSSES